MTRAVSPARRASVYGAGPDAGRPSIEDDPNVVRLAGRVGSAPVERDLPSGDRILTWRIIVEQPEPNRRRAASRRRIDTIDCVAWAARVRRSAAGLKPGDRIVATGSLHRRFWRSPAGPASRYEVEVKRIQKPRGQCGVRASA